MDTARKGRSTEEIIAALREAEGRISEGETVGKICRSLGISEQTYYNWRREYDGRKLDQAKRLKELERENERQKKAISELTLDKLILKEVLTGSEGQRSKNTESFPGSERAVDTGQGVSGDRRAVGMCKTTLLRLVAGLDFPTIGNARVGDKEMQARQVKQLIAMMHLEGHENVFPHQLSGGMHSVSPLHAAMPSLRLFFSSKSVRNGSGQLSMVPGSDWVGPREQGQKTYSAAIAARLQKHDALIGVSERAMAKSSFCLISTISTFSPRRFRHS